MRVLLLALAWTLLGSFPTVSSADTATRPLLKNKDAWFSSEEAQIAATNILTYQSDFGGWPKNLNLTVSPFTGKRAELTGELKPIFDNGATTDEIRFMAKMYRATGEPRYLRSVQNGMDYIFISQYPTGGWPQFYPLDKVYHRHITFNDDSMVRILSLLREVAEKDEFTFLDADRREQAGIAFQRGIECVLKCQIRKGDRLTAWCAQHDEVTYEPRPARAFELVSLSGAESVRIVTLLMSLPKPSPEVIQAIEGAVQWFNESRITGWRVEELPRNAGNGQNYRATQDSSASPIWARFYDIETNEPLWSDMTSTRKLGIANVGWARHGYDWTGPWPKPLLEKAYPKWKEKLAKEGTGLKLEPWKPKARIALAGDSTVTDTAGWGFGFKKAVSAGVLCQNFAAGGQSSKSFRDSGAWQRTLDSKPDYVLIQFGHNDMPGKGPKRETDPATTYAENLTRFIKDAREAGAKPVLVTSLVRRIFEQPGPDGKNKLRGEQAPYVDAARKVATEQNVPLIDLYSQSFARVIELGPTGVAPWEPTVEVKPVPSAPKTEGSNPTDAARVDPAKAPQAPSNTQSITAPARPDSKPTTPAATDIDTPAAMAATRRDGTHLNALGSIEFGAWIAKELTRVLPEAAPFIRGTP